MAKIIYNNYDLNVENLASRSGENCYSMTHGNVLLHKYRNVKNYACLDGYGINLTDDTCVFAQSTDNIGFVSTALVGETSMNVKLTFNFNISDHINLTRGITLTPHDNLPNDIYITIVYKENGTAKTKTFNNLPFFIGKYFFAWDKVYTDVTKVTLWFKGKGFNDDDTYANTNSLYKIDGVDFGEDVDVANIIGEITAVGEIDLNCTDLPSSNCDFTAEFLSEPIQGQYFTIESKSFNSRYHIEEIERTAETLYTIHGSDDITLLENMLVRTMFAENVEYDYKNIYFEDKLKNDFYGRIKLDDHPNYRQYYAMKGLTQLLQYSTFNDAVGIHYVDFENDTDIKSIISADRILGRAEYKAVEEYAGVTMTVTDLSADLQYTGSAVTSADSLSTAYLNITALNLVKGTEYSNENVSDTCENALRFLNGAEITATIVYDNENLGDWVQIQTPFNGIKTGIIKSIELTIGSHSTIANIVVKEAEAD